MSTLIIQTLMMYIYYSYKDQQENLLLFFYKRFKLKENKQVDYFKFLSELILDGS